MPVDAKRSYRSPLREESARRTREQIRDAAADLFVERGYVSTTIRNVADAAGVAVRTVFSTFPGGKVELFHEALRAAIDGDAESDSVTERLTAEAYGDDADRILDAVVGYGADLLERAGRLLLTAIESAGADEDMRSFALEGAQETASNAMSIAEGLAAHDLLRPEISVQHAADVLCTVVSPQVHASLRRQCGWDVDEYRGWVKATIRASLLR